MGNQCQPCETITQGCKREQFRQQLKNRQKLNISRVNSHDKSKSKFESVKSLSKINEQQQSPQLKKSSERIKYEQINKQLLISQKGYGQSFQFDKKNSIEQIYEDFKNMKIPIQTSQKNQTEKDNINNNNNNDKENSILNTNKNEKLNNNNNNNNNKSENSNIHIKETDSIKQSKLQYDQNELFNRQKQRDKKSMITLRNSQYSNKQNKKNKDSSIINGRGHTTQSKQSPTIIQDYFNPSKVLKEFNRELKQEEEDNVQSQSKIENLKQLNFQVKRGVYFEGFQIASKLSKAGVVKFENGAEILAHFSQGQLDPSKTVKVTFTNKSVYEGQIQNYKANGYGKLTFKDGTYYIGEWKDDKPHGKGKQLYSDGSVYQGEFCFGVKNGFGKYYDSQEQIVYEGEFKQNKFQGQGCLSYADGRIYQGNFINGQLQGQGQIEYTKQGAKYIGEFRESKKHGKGKYFYGDGRIWQGQWRENRQNGVGKYKDQKGKITEGIWIDGIKSQSSLSFKQK